MEDVKVKLDTILNLLNFTNPGEVGKLIEAKNMLELYVTKYFDNSQKYQKIIDEINVEPKDTNEYYSTRRFL